MFVKTPAPLDVGTRFVANLTWPEFEVPLEVSAEVVRAVKDGSQPGMGVRFIYSGEAQRTLLESQLGRLLGPHRLNS
jgi:hypothetical protein